MGKDTDQDKKSAQGKKPRRKNFREKSTRLRKGEEVHIRHRASLDWQADHIRVCAEDGDESDIVPLADVLAVLRNSRTACALLEEKEGRDNLKILYDNQIIGSQLYPRAGKSVITLNPCRPFGDLLILLTRELRRLWQYHHGALVNPLSYEPDEAILVNRAQTADALMMSIKVAWELKLAGEGAAWNFLAGSPVADIGRCFEREAATDFRTLNNGRAARAAYDKFFEDNRTKIHDKHIIHQMLLDETGYMREAADRPAVSMELFTNLGSLPGGSNYFSSKGNGHNAARMPMDELYTAVEDRSNANFLWFIKFERSFHEKEMQMLEESVRLSAEIVDFAKWSLRDKAGDDV